MNEKYLQILRSGIVGVLVLIFAFALYRGFLWGKRKADSSLVVHNAKEILTSLNLFYKDQERFPTINEFGDKGSFGLYVSNMLPDRAPTGCGFSVSYAILANGKPTVSMCLSESAAGFPAGVSTLPVVYRE